MCSNLNDITGPLYTSVKDFTFYVSTERRVKKQDFRNLMFIAHLIADRYMPALRVLAAKQYPGVAPYSIGYIFDFYDGGLQPVVEFFLVSPNQADSLANGRYFPGHTYSICKVRHAPEYTTDDKVGLEVAATEFCYPFPLHYDQPQNPSCKYARTAALLKDGKPLDTVRDVVDEVFDHLPYEHAHDWLLSPMQNRGDRIRTLHACIDPHIQATVDKLNTRLEILLQHQ